MEWCGCDDYFLLPWASPCMISIALYRNILFIESYVVFVMCKRRHASLIYEPVRNCVSYYEARGLCFRTCKFCRFLPRKHGGISYGLEEMSGVVDKCRIILNNNRIRRFYIFPWIPACKKVYRLARKSLQFWCFLLEYRQKIYRREVLCPLF